MGITYSVRGTGEPLLLLNGIAMSAASWQPVAGPLEESFRVVRCDLRGQLMSPGPPHPSIHGHVDDVAELLEDLGLGPVHVLATSFGGVVGALLAARRPELVRSLVSIASADGFTEGMAKEVRRWRAASEAILAGADASVLSDTLEPIVYSRAWLEAHRSERELRRQQIAVLPRRWVEGLVDLLTLAEGLDHARELAAIRCPTLVIAAGEDGFIPLDRTRALAEVIPGARFEVMEGAGHAVVIEQPQAIVARVRDFVGGL